MIEILKNVLSECEEYVNQLKKCPKGYFLYRGSHLQIGDCKLFTSRLDNRPPLNTPQHLHDAVNETFLSQFEWKIRNGVFCYGYTSLTDIPAGLGYGQQYLCFPVGRFTFIYSPDHFDLCGHFYQKQNKVTDDEIKRLVFKDDSIKDAIDTGNHKSGLSNEISVNVPTYYLVDVIHRDILANAIWT